MNLTGIINNMYKTFTKWVESAVYYNHTPPFNMCVHILVYAALLHNKAEMGWLNQRNNNNNIADLSGCWAEQACGRSPKKNATRLYNVLNTLLAVFHILNQIYTTRPRRWKITNKSIILQCLRHHNHPFVFNYTYICFLKCTRCYTHIALRKCMWHVHTR